MLHLHIESYTRNTHWWRTDSDPATFELLQKANRALLRHLLGITQDLALIQTQDLSLALAEFDSKHKIPMQQALKQMQQYINYGPGAIIFLNGFVPDLQSYVKSNIGDILLLDASELDLTSLDAI